MSPEELTEKINSGTPEVTSLHRLDIYVDWSWPHRGFGQIRFTYDKITGIVTCENECMSRESVRKILHAMADHIADNCLLADEPINQGFIK